MAPSGREPSFAAWYFEQSERLVTAGADVPARVLQESIIEGLLNFAQQSVVRTELQ